MTGTPDFSKFGADAARSRLRQRGSTVTISHRTWLGTIGLGFLAAIAGFFSIVPTIAGNDTIALPVRALLFLVFVLAAGGAILYLLYRHEILFDFGAKHYQIRRGFLWNIRDRRASFADIRSVTVTERAHSTDTRHRYKTYSVGLECNGEEPTFDFWQTTEEEKARLIADTLAGAFGAEIRWETPVGERVIRRLLRKDRQ